MTSGPIRAVTPPAGFSVPGARGDAAPDSLLGQLRAEAKQKRATATITVDLERGDGRVPMRSTYGVLGLDELERFDEATMLASNASGSLEIMARACRSIEVYDAAEDRWWVLEDDAGPVTFDDRLARLLGWDRPAEDFEYPVRAVYEQMFDGNGFAVGLHIRQVAAFYGVTEEAIASGEASTPGGTTRSVPPPPSA